MAAHLLPLIPLFLLPVARAELCATSADCIDSLSCTIDFCEPATQTCVNLAPSLSCDSMRRILPRSKLVAAANIPPIRTEARASIARLTARVLCDFHPHRLLHLNFLYVDPVARLHEYEAELLEENTTTTSNILFHERMFSIVQTIDDRHTQYRAPTPLFESRAFLPFVVKPYFETDEDEPRYVVTNIASGTAISNTTFPIGSRVVSWDSEPVHELVHRLGREGYGSNVPAKLANGLNTLRVRFLAIHDFPQSNSVNISFITRGGEEASVNIDWIYATKVTNSTLPLFMDEGPFPHPLTVATKERVPEFEHDTSTDQTVSSSGDGIELLQLPSISAEPGIEDGEELAEEAMRSGKRQTIFVNATFCGGFAAEVVPTTHGPVGRLHLTSSTEASIKEVVSELGRVLQLMPRNGLVVDVRSNGGGLVVLVKVISDLLTAKDFEFLPFTVRATFLIEVFVNKKFSSVSPALEEVFGSIRPSMNTSRRTGDPNAGTLPFESPSRFPIAYERPYVFVADGLTYSSGDIFTALHVDNDLAPVVISGGNTGAGGSTVNMYSDLADEFPNLFPPLPANLSLATSSFRILRSGKSRGAILEYFGVEPDLVYWPTLMDRLGNVKDLFDLLAKIVTDTAANNATNSAT